MKKVLMILLDLLTIALLIGGYVIQYYTKGKLGMLRWVLYKEAKVKETVPVDMLKYIVVTAVVLLVAIIVVNFVKNKKKHGKTDTVMLAVLVILTGVYLVFTVFVTNEMVKAYYFVLPLIGLAVFMQIIRSGIAVWTCKDEK